MIVELNVCVNQIAVPLFEGPMVQDLYHDTVNPNLILVNGLIVVKMMV